MGETAEGQAMQVFGDEIRQTILQIDPGFRS
jgi:hypothetical protein